MDILQQVVVMLLTLAVLIAFHEYGHFWVARKCGVKVLRFSIGFGTPLLKWKDKLNTEYVISVLPLGGYVKMLDEREVDTVISDQERPYAFNNKTVGQRIAIVSAGPIANFILAIVVLWFVYLGGVSGLAPIVFGVKEGTIAHQAGLVDGHEIVAVDGEKTSTVQHVTMQLVKRVGDTGDIIIETRLRDSDVYNRHVLKVENWLGHTGENIGLYSDLGIQFYRPEIKDVFVNLVQEGSPAEKSGLEKGDQITSFDGVGIDDWEQMANYIRARPGKTIEFGVVRSGSSIFVKVTPKSVDFEGGQVGQIGIAPVFPKTPEYLIRKREYGVFSAWEPALKRTWALAVLSLQAVKKMIFGEISYKQLSGPISIAKIASDSVDSGFYSYLSLLAWLSISLGVLNLLPIPVLDGGHILFYCIEWIKGSPVSEKIQVFAYQIGIAVVMSIMVLAVVNDISRL